MSIEVEHHRFMPRYKAASAEDVEFLRTQGHALAQRLRRAVIDLCYNEATEFSPLIPEYSLMPDSVGLLALGTGAAVLEPLSRTYTITDVSIFQATS